MWFDDWAGAFSWCRIQSWLATYQVVMFAQHLVATLRPRAYLFIINNTVLIKKLSIVLSLLIGRWSLWVFHCEDCTFVSGLVLETRYLWPQSSIIVTVSDAMNDQVQATFTLCTFSAQHLQSWLIVADTCSLKLNKQIN